MRAMRSSTPGLALLVCALALVSFGADSSAEGSAEGEITARPEEGERAQLCSFFTQINDLYVCSSDDAGAHVLGEANHAQRGVLLKEMGLPSTASADQVCAFGGKIDAAYGCTGPPKPEDEKQLVKPMDAPAESRPVDRPATPGPAAAPAPTSEESGGQEHVVTAGKTGEQLVQSERALREAENEADAAEAKSLMAVVNVINAKAATEAARLIREASEEQLEGKRDAEKESREKAQTTADTKKKHEEDALEKEAKQDAQKAKAAVP